MEQFKSLVSSDAPRDLWPDASEGFYVYHDPIGDLQIVNLKRPVDTLIVLFDGCDEEFDAEGLAGKFEGPLSPEQHGDAVRRIEQLRN